MPETIRVTVWNEGRHEKQDAAIARLYPEGIHGALAASLRRQECSVQTATLDDPEHGLSEALLDQTDVLMWWGHTAHHEVRDEIVERVHRQVLGGMGLIALHSAHFSKIFRQLMGTSCDLKWREAGEKERLWVVAPDHPIAAGLGRAGRPRAAGLRSPAGTARAAALSSPSPCRFRYNQAAGP